MKNLARTLSLFLIFSENYYKSKTRNIMTELCYKRWFTTLKNDKVLIKQSKNQSTYSFAGQKLTTLFSIHFLLKLFNFWFTLQDPLRLLYVLCKSSSSNWLYAQNAGYLYKIVPCLFLFGHKVTSILLSSKVTSILLSEKAISTSLFHNIMSHDSLHMTGYDFMQWCYDIRKTFVLSFKLQETLLVILFLLLSRLHPNNFSLFAPTLFLELSLVL